MADEKMNQAPQGESRPQGHADSSRDRRNPQAGGHGRPQGRDGNRRFASRREQDPYEDQVVDIKKITKVVKGGKHMRFSALVVIGNGRGEFGFGQGKSAEVPVAIRKAIDYAHGNLVKVPMTKSKTIPHEVRGKCGVCEVYLKPAPEGTGIIAGGAVRSIMQLAGIRNIYSKVYGRRTPINVVRATVDAVKQLKDREYVQRARLSAKKPAAPEKNEEAE